MQNLHPKIISQAKTRQRKIWRERIQLKRDIEQLEKKGENLLREAENILLKGLLESKLARKTRRENYLGI